MGEVPGYVRLHDSGELQERVERALARLEACRVCPRHCEVNRLANETKVCMTGRHAYVSSYAPHLGEEDCLRGWKGSGTIFFSGCNLKCVFCQNYDISQQTSGAEVKPERLADLMLELQELGCHNINWVTPQHVVPQIIESLPSAIVGGLRLPIVYNTNAYDSLDSLRLLDGIVDIYMPDFKYWSEEKAKTYLTAPDYPEAARAAFREMHRQVGDLVCDGDGIAQRGLLVRHLVMPGGTEETGEIMRFLADELSADTYVNIMDQYHPENRVSGGRFEEIDCRITSDELAEAYRAAEEAGLHRFDERKRRVLFRF